MPHRYIGLLRGINVGKAKRVAMADLRALLVHLGFQNVRTLLNSGNFVFTSRDDTNVADVVARIETAFQKDFGFSSRLILLTADELAEVVLSSPFDGIATDASRYLAVFLSNPADLVKLEPLTMREWTPEAVALGRRVAYLWCPDGVLHSAAVEAAGRVLKDGATTRNWSTVTKLHALAAEGVEGS